jgi:hypothetical protein
LAGAQQLNKQIQTGGIAARFTQIAARFNQSSLQQQVFVDAHYFYIA